MNIIRICTHSGEKNYSLHSKFTRYSKKQSKKKDSLQIFNLISSMESYKKVLISYLQYSDW